jgi:hypothetical protein
MGRLLAESSSKSKTGFGANRQRLNKLASEVLSYRLLGISRGEALLNHASPVPAVPTGRGRNAQQNGVDQPWRMNSSPASPLMTLEKLHFAFVLFRLLPCLERAEVAAMASFGISLPRIEPVLTGF